MDQDYHTDTASEPIQPEAPSFAEKVGEFFLETFKTILLALLIYFAISAVTDRVRVENVSMQPTLYEGELLVVWEPAYVLGEPKRGDIIVFHHNGQTDEDYIKRVIGLPYDTISVRDGQVIVNGQVLSEPYIAEITEYEGDWSVPANSLFVLGDNRNRSSDSHVWGFVPMQDVVGRAVFLYWPFEEIRILNHRDLLETRS